MPQKIISEKTEGNLAILNKKGLLKDFYLGGGTGLALQLEHRVSLDLDFFTKKDIATAALSQKIKRLGAFSITKEAENTLVGRFNGTNLAFFTYNYPILFPFRNFQGTKLADGRDIACMKLSAISSRGAKKDFIDLFFVCKKIIPLKALLLLFEEKYKKADYNIMHILKSLIYFNDAEKEPMPKMLESITWKQVKDFFRIEIKNINKHL